MKKKYFNLAKKLSQYSTHHTHKMGAAIIKKNKIIGVGFNKIQTHPLSKDPYKMIHAEMCAIFNAKQDLNGCDIYIYRQLKDGSLGVAKPCQACEAMLREAGIRNIFYTDYEGYKSYSEK